MKGKEASIPQAAQSAMLMNLDIASSSGTFHIRYLQNSRVTFDSGLRRAYVFVVEKPMNWNVRSPTLFSICRDRFNSLPNCRLQARLINQWKTACLDQLHGVNSSIARVPQRNETGCLGA
jgi:hypothetical protein